MKTVYLAACLAQRHPDVYHGIKTALASADVRLVEIPGTENIWIRDWMPIRRPDPIHPLVKFRPKADTVKYPFLDVPESCWRKVMFGDDLSFHDQVMYSDIILDGGNVVRSPDGKRVIMCEQTSIDNPSLDTMHYGRARRLEEVLEAEIIWIPNEPGDTLGHADGCVQWIDDDMVFINDYRSMRDDACSAYMWNLESKLDQEGFEAIPFPYAYDRCRNICEARFRREHPQADDFNMAYGYYLNFLKIDNLVLYPTFGIDRDERCLDALLDAWPDAKCVGIDCSYLAEEGGLLHCVSAEF